MSGVVSDAEWLSMRMMAISSIALSVTLSGLSLYAILHRKLDRAFENESLFGHVYPFVSIDIFI